MYETFAVRVLVPVLLRFALAVVFVYHGLEKVQGEGTKGGTYWHTQAIEKAKAEIKEKGGDESAAGEPLPIAFQTAVAWGELIGGLALALGLLTRYAALGIICIMAGAIATVHGKHGFAGPMGFEYNFVIIIIATCLVLIGGGTFALDRILKIK